MQRRIIGGCVYLIFDDAAEERDFHDHPERPVRLTISEIEELERQIAQMKFEEATKFMEPFLQRRSGHFAG